MKKLLVLILALSIVVIMNHESFAEKSTFFDSVKFIQYLDENTALEEVPDAITILTDLIKKAKDGGIDVIEDEHGNWLEFIGAKGYIPPYMMEYNRAANHNSIVTTLVDDCYEITYETDEDTGIIKLDDNNEPIVLRRVAVNVGTQRRNLNQSCELASSGARAILQAKILGAISGTSPIGMDGTWDKRCKMGSYVTGTEDENTNRRLKWWICKSNKKHH